MAKILIGIVATFVIGVASFFGFKELVEGREVKEKEVAIQEKNVEKKENVEQDEERIKEIFEDTVNSIFYIFESVGAEKGWDNTNKADFELIRPEFLEFSTENFADTVLKEMTENYYCECDHIFKPIINYDVRFEFKEVKDERIEIDAMETSTEIENMGFLWNFVLVNEEGRWKIDSWERTSLEGKDIKLTEEEIAIILAEKGDISFVKEYQSEEAGGKAYIFKIENGDNELVQAISSRDTKRVYDFENEKIKVQDEKEDSNNGLNAVNTDDRNRKETIINNDIFNNYSSDLSLGLKMEELVLKHGDPIEKKESEKDISLIYFDAIYSVSKNNHRVYKVQLIGEKVPGYYKDFTELFDTYFKGIDLENGEGSEFTYEKYEDDGKYYLEMDRMIELHTFGSKNESGYPIDYIVIENSYYEGLQ